MKALLKSATVELFALSMLSLFLELLAIRWLSADIRAFTVFRTFPLVACFIGLGVGFARQDERAYRFTPFCIALMVLVIRVADSTGVSSWTFPSVSTFQWANPDAPIGLAAAGTVTGAALLSLAPAFFASAAIGNRLGILFSKLPNLTAYSVNLSGAIAGSLLFSLFCYLELNPLWLASGAVFASMLFLQSATKRPYFASLAAVLTLAVALLLPTLEARSLNAKFAVLADGPSKTYWSPYQRIDLKSFSMKEGSAKVPVGLELGVNHFFHQYYFDPKIDPSKLPKDVVSELSDLRRIYSLPFLIKPAERVLVVGAGTGMNVAFGKQLSGAAFDAVEIDPVILRIGQERNTYYKDPKVTLICNDARQFLRKPHQNYDLIIYGYLDSQSVVGQGASVRLDNYIYTKECFTDAMRSLKPGGIITVSFCVETPWIGERIYRTLQAAVGYPPMLVKTTPILWSYVVGDPVKDGSLKLPSNYVSAKAPSVTETGVLTDDWPYLYLKPNVFDGPLITMLVFVLAAGLISGRRLLFQKPEQTSIQMFFLGAAFMLMELHAVSLLALVYGSTWFVSALMINGILLVALAANLLVSRFSQQMASPTIAYSMLLLSLIFNYFCSSQMIDSIFGAELSGLVLTALTLTPFIFAGIIFSSSFAKSSNSSNALAFNLFGAVIGAFLEYLSNWYGIRSLVLVSIVLYAASWLAIMISTRDVEVAVPSLNS